MDKFQMQRKTKHFAIDVWKLCQKLPHSREFNRIAGQLIRSSTSVTANYRASCRAKSRADFINKLKIVEEEADEMPMRKRFSYRGMIIKGIPCVK